MKNKDKYDLTKIDFKKKITKDRAYLLAFDTDVYYEGKKIAIINGGSHQDQMVWLEEENER